MRRRVTHPSIGALLVLVFLALTNHDVYGQACTPPPSGMVDWWPGDGNAQDIVGSANGTIQGGLTFTPGEVSGAFTFDGSSAVLFGSAGNVSTGDFSYDFWLNTTSNAKQEIFSKRVGCGTNNFYDIRTLDNLTLGGGHRGHLLVELDSATAPQTVEQITNAEINDGLYHLIAVVRQGTTTSIYVDGALDSAVTTPTVIDVSNSGQLRASLNECIGSDGTVPLRGQLDEIEFFNRALSAKEVGVIYVAGSAGKCKSCQVSPVTPLYQAVDPQNHPVPWACVVYNDPYHWDSLSKYCSPNDPGGTNTRISQKGCSLTDLTMALATAGVVFSDPSYLNSYMVNHPGDFDPGSHDVSWDTTVDDLAVTSGKSLAYTSFISNSPQDLQDNLCSSGYPVIVGVDLAQSTTGRLVPGHFVLVTGLQGSQFQIVDPGHPLLTTLDAYQNVFQTRGYITDPVMGDKSSLHLSVGGAELLAIDPSGNMTGYSPNAPNDLTQIPQSSYFRDALENDETGAPPTQVGYFIDIHQPPQGNFSVVVDGLSTSTYSVSLRAFASDGSAQTPVLLNGSAEPGSNSTYTLHYSSTPGSPPTVTPMPGDRNGDGVVNCADIAIVKASFGKKIGDPGFDPRADANVDGIVNVVDLAIVGKGLPKGTKCP